MSTPPRDVVATLAAGNLATKPVTASESVLAVAWEDGSFVILNRALRPEELAVALKAYTSRVLEGPPNAG
jgi:Flp pilus assembly protein CpaB